VAGKIGSTNLNSRIVAMKFQKISMDVAKCLLIILGLTSGATYAQDKQSILFVCEHGAARSAIAAAYFNKIAKEKGLNYEAHFRGTDPQDSLSPGARIGLVRDGFNIAKMKPTVVSESDIKQAAQVITFDCKLPANTNPKNLERWDGIPPISESYDIARDQIEAKVRALVHQLVKK